VEAEYQKGGKGKWWKRTKRSEATVATRRGNPGNLAFRFQLADDGEEPISVYFTMDREDFPAIFETMLRAVGSRPEE